MTSSPNFDKRYVYRTSDTLHLPDVLVNIVWYSVYRNGRETQIRDEAAGRAPARDAAPASRGHGRVTPHAGACQHHHERDSPAGWGKQVDRLQPLPGHD